MTSAAGVRPLTPEQEARAQVEMAASDAPAFDWPGAVAACVELTKHRWLAHTRFVEAWDRWVVEAHHHSWPPNAWATLRNDGRVFLTEVPSYAGTYRDAGGAAALDRRRVPRPGDGGSGMRPQTQAERHTIDTAWHEAGHMVGAWAAGLRVSSVRCMGERAAAGQTEGRTRVNARDFLAHPPSDAARRVYDLAGDAVDAARGHPDTAETLEVVGAVGQAAFNELWAAARKLVADRWESIGEVAAALLASPDLALYPGRDPVLDAGNEAAAPGRDEAERRELADATAGRESEGG